MTAVRVSSSATEEDGARLWPLYDGVFGDQPGRATWLESVWNRHRAREGFRWAVATEDDGEPVGLAWGHTGHAGEWWTERLRATLDPEVVDAWLHDYWGLVTIGVAERARGRGVGRTLLTAITAAAPGPRLLLQTSADPADPARTLYASEGWTPLGPGAGDGTVVLGRAAPAARGLRYTG